MELIFSQLLDGLSIGAVLLLAATGLAIVFGLMGVINLAHGEFMMIRGTTCGCPAMRRGGSARAAY